MILYQNLFSIQLLFTNTKHNLNSSVYKTSPVAVEFFSIVRGE